MIMLRIQGTILQLISQVAPTVTTIARKDADLAKQIRRALSSAALNVAEGSDQRGGRRNSHYSIALGSSREALAGLEAAAAWGYIAPLPPATADTFDKVHATLFRIIHGR
jgi:four helix bundle protein